MSKPQALLQGTLSLLILKILDLEPRTGWAISQRIRQMLQATMAGAPLDDFRDGEETVSIVAREPDASRSLLSSVDSVYVPTDFGGFVPLSQVA